MPSIINGDDVRDILLHIGGTEVKGWSILNITPGSGVGYVGSCTDLSAIPDASCSARLCVPRSLNTLDTAATVRRALNEIHRVMTPELVSRVPFRISILLCRLWLHQGSFAGTTLRSHADDLRWPRRTRDVRYMGLNFTMLGGFLTAAGFVKIKRVDEHGVFNDTSSYRFLGQPISLNIKAWKAA